MVENTGKEDSKIRWWYKLYMISIIAALGKNRALGLGNELLWPIPDDLKRFKELTTGHAIIMGSKTYESIGKPLPNRTNIIITRNEEYDAPGAIITHSLEEAIEKAGDGEVFIIGGAQIYTLALPFADKLYLTLINDEKEADAFFPDYSEFKKETLIEEREFEGIKYSWVNFEK